MDPCSASPRLVGLGRECCDPAIAGATIKLRTTYPIAMLVALVLVVRLAITAVSPLPFANNLFFGCGHLGLAQSCLLPPQACSESHVE